MLGIWRGLIKSKTNKGGSESRRRCHMGSTVGGERNSLSLVPRSWTYAVIPRRLPTDDCRKSHIAAPRDQISFRERWRGARIPVRGCESAREMLMVGLRESKSAFEERSRSPGRCQHRPVEGERMAEKKEQKSTAERDGRQNHDRASGRSEEEAMTKQGFGSEWRDLSFLIRGVRWGRGRRFNG